MVSEGYKSDTLFITTFMSSTKYINIKNAAEDSRVEDNIFSCRLGGVHAFEFVWSVAFLRFLRNASKRSSEQVKGVIANEVTAVSLENGHSKMWTWKLSISGIALKVADGMLFGGDACPFFDTFVAPSHKIYSKKFSDHQRYSNLSLENMMLKEWENINHAKCKKWFKRHFFDQVERIETEMTVWTINVLSTFDKPLLYMVGWQWELKVLMEKNKNLVEDVQRKFDDLMKECEELGRSSSSSPSAFPPNSPPPPPNIASPRCPSLNKVEVCYFDGIADETELLARSLFNYCEDYENGAINELLVRSLFGNYPHMHNSTTVAHIFHSERKMWGLKNSLLI